MAETTKRTSRTKVAGRRTKAAPTASSAGRKADPRPRARRTRESRAARAARAGHILRALRATYPKATTALRYGSPFELLVATVLSAQCTDQRVNLVTPDLFRRYPDPAALADAEQDDLEAAIRSTGFFRNKSRSLLGMSRAICDEFDGQVPDSMEALLTLPGVARKTANCVLGTCFGMNVGIVVDTHVGRLAQRLRLLVSARDDKTRSRSSVT